MKIVVVKRIIFLLVFLLGYSAVNAADDLITKQIIIKLDKAGTLPDKIGSTKKNKITNLKIVGDVNGTDWGFIREMLGMDNFQSVGKGNLSVLDLSETKIVEGGIGYINSNSYPYAYYTKDNSLGTFAFVGCSGLTSLELPSGITSIEGEAFEGCSGLTRLELPSGITSIESGVFEGCSGLASLELPSGITYIGPAAFASCSGLSSLELPSGITSIEFNTFHGCSGLTSLAIPSGVTSIGRSAFNGCSGLTSLELPSGITSIEEEAFEGCSGLTSLALPSGVTSIDDDVFQGCSGLTSLAIPSGVTSIGNNAFYGCSGLTSLAIPSGVTSIGYNAFSCSGLSSISVNWETPPSIDSSVFYEVDKQKCTLYVPKGTFQDYWLADVWGDFENIVEYDVTGVDNVTTSTDAKEISRYSVNGQRLSAPTKGLNIVKYSDGSVKKVAVQ